LAVLGVLLLTLFVAAPIVWAFEGREGDVVVVEADEVIDDDLYVGAQEFRLEGTVKGDVIAAGATIEINGVVEGDLIAAGQTVVIDGEVGDDARIAGYALSVEGDVGDDLLAFGFSLENDDESSVGGDMLFGGYQVMMDGDVGGTADIGGGAVEVTGNVDGNLNVDVGGTAPNETMPPGFPFFPGLPTVPSVPAGLTLGEGATIGGDLNYTANEEINVPAGVVSGEVDFTQYVPPEQPTPQAKEPSPLVKVGKWLLHQAQRFAALLVVGALMMWLVPDWTREVVGTLRRQPLPSLGWGFVAIGAVLVALLALVIATGLLAAVLGLITLGELLGRAITLGGLVTGAVGFSFSVTWAYVTRVIVGVLLGQLIFRLFKSPAEQHRWWPMLVGVPIFAILAAIPILGWLIRLAAVLFGLGAIWIWTRDWLRARQGPAPAEAEAPATIA
jgi:hypothetical protein